MRHVSTIIVTLVMTLSIFVPMAGASGSVAPGSGMGQVRSILSTSVPGHAQDPDEDVGVALRINFMEFDPLIDGPPTPPLGLSGHGDLWLLQFKGPVLEQWKDEIRAMGASFHWYEPKYSFIITCKEQDIGAISHHRAVRWVGPYMIDYKVHPDLWGVRGKIKVLVSPLEDHHRATEDLLAHGAQIEFSEPYMVVAKLDGPTLLEVAQSSSIGYIGPFHKQQTINNNAARIIHVRQNTDGAFTNDGQSLWSFNTPNFPGHGGNGVTVAVMDTGVDGNHPTFNTPAKKVWYKDYCTGSTNTWTDSGSHGTHVAGIVLGNGNSTGTYAGMAPNAKLVGMRTLNCGGLNTPMKDAIAHGASLTSNSWVEMGSYGNYDALAQAMDAYTRDADTVANGDQPLLHVCGAGNDGNNGVQPPATAKNVIAVGAVGDNRGTSENTVAGFSGKGPVDDGRIKPDIVTPGVSVYSARKGQTGYVAMSGTSMATPAASGGIAVMKNYYKDKHGFEPSPALSKAIAINGADILSGYAWPGNSQGWGRMNVANSLLETSTKKIEYVEEKDTLALSTGFQVRFPLTVNSNAEMRASLVWTDKPGASNNPKPALVNDIDLKLTAPSTSSYWGNHFASKLSTAGGNADAINNIESFRQTSVETGAWTLDIIGTNIPKGPQDWALVISGDISLGTPVLNYVEVYPTGLVVTPTPSVEGDMLTIGGKIMNIGNMPASAVDYEVRYDGQVLDSGTIALLSQGASKDISIDVIALRGDHNVKITTDKGNNIIEKDENNNTVEFYFTVDHYGLDAQAKITEADLDPGEGTDFKIEIDNTGSIEDTYVLNLTLEGDRTDDWTVSLDDASLQLGPGTANTTALNVLAPAMIEALSQLRVHVVITSVGNSTYTDAFTFIININTITGFEAYIDHPKGSVLPGEPILYNMTVNNTGNQANMISLFIDATPPGWDVSFNLSIANLAPYANMTFGLSVTSPLTALADEVGVVEVSARSNNQQITTLTTETIVKKVLGMGYTVEQMEDHVLPGQEAEFNIDIINLGNGNDNVSLEAEVPDGFSSELDIDQIDLIAFEETMAFLSVTPGQDALVGDYPITIRGWSLNTSFEETFTLTVDQIHGLKMSAGPELVKVEYGGSTSFDITVTNTGNGDEKFVFSLEGLRTPMTSSFSRREVEIGPGEEGKSVLSVHSNKIEGGLFLFSVNVVSSTDDTTNGEQTLRLEVGSKPVPRPPPSPIPSPFPGGDDKDSTNTSLFSKYWPIILILMAIVVVTIVAIMVRRRKRRTNGALMEQRHPHDRYPQGATKSLLDHDPDENTYEDYEDLEVDDQPMFKDVNGPYEPMDQASTIPSNRHYPTRPSIGKSRSAVPPPSDEVTLEAPRNVNAPSSSPVSVPPPEPIIEPQVSKPPIASPPAPPVQGRPSTRPEARSEAETVAKPQSGPKPKPDGKDDDIDDMISNLLSNI